MKKSKKIIAAMALTLGFIGTAASSASAFSYSDTLNDGNKVTVSLIQSNAGGFKARSEARTPCKFMSAEIERDTGREGFETLVRETVRDQKLVHAYASDATSSDDILAQFHVRYSDGGTTASWHHALEYYNGSYSNV